jgi:hypothetical protein
MRTGVARVLDHDDRTHRFAEHPFERGAYGRRNRIAFADIDVPPSLPRESSR